VDMILQLEALEQASEILEKAGNDASQVLEIANVSVCTSLLTHT
jgi:hypothetical protein